MVVKSLCGFSIYRVLTLIDEAPSKDKTFRRYANGVDRSLSLFDTALQEWADYISFLGRLLKVCGLQKSCEINH